jgi:4-amino-4-deoxy-L-arabinose transferase-like glycosyltransferase
VTCRDELYSLWPPLYPALIALGERCGIDAFESVRWMHALAIAATIVLCAQLVARVSGSVWPAVACATVLAASFTFYRYWVLVGSEPLFICLCVAAVAAWAEYTERRRLRSMLAMTAWAALACLQRYLGVTLVATLAFALLIDKDGGPWVARLRRALGFAGACALPVLAWCVRNRMLEHTWTGGRDPSQYAFADNVSDGFRAASAWAAPSELIGGDPRVAGAIACVVTIAGLVVAARQVRSRPSAAVVRVLWIFPCVYAAVLIALTTRWMVDRIDGRFMLPAFPFCVATALLAVHAVHAATERWLPRWAGRAALALITGVFAVNGVLTLAHWMPSYVHDGAGGFHTRFYMEHPLYRATRERPATEVVHSNLPELIWLSNGAPVRMLISGRKLHARLGEQVRASGAPCTVVWFVREDGKPVLFEDEIERSAAIEVVLSDPRGRILRVRPR